MSAIFYYVNYPFNEREIARIIPDTGTAIGKFLASEKLDLIDISAKWRQPNPNNPQRGYEGYETQYWLPRGTAHKYHCAAISCVYNLVPEIVTIEQVTFIDGYMHFLDENRNIIYN